MDRTLIVQKMTNYFSYLLLPNLLWDELYWKLFKKRVLVPKLSGRKELDLRSVADLDQEKEEFNYRIKLIKLHIIPFVIGLLVGTVAAFALHSYIPYIIAGSIPLFGACILLAACLVRDVDYSILLSFNNFILSLIWGIGCVIGIVISSLIFH